MQSEELIRELEKHPNLVGKLERILSLVAGRGELGDTADDVEEEAVELMRRLGADVITEWAVEKNSREAEQVRQTQESARPLKKR